MKLPMMILLVFGLSMLTALGFFVRGVARDAHPDAAPNVAVGAPDDDGQARRTSHAPPRPLYGSTGPWHQVDEAVTPDATPTAAPPPAAPPVRSLGQLFAAQADDVCACDQQACVDEVLIRYAAAMSAVVHSTDDDAATRAAAERMATCQHQHEAKWGLPSTDNHPISINERTDTQEQAQ